MEEGPFNTLTFDAFIVKCTKELYYPEARLFLIHNQTNQGPGALPDFDSDIPTAATLKGLTT